MKRILLVTFLGLLGGTVGHFACYFLQSPNGSSGNLDAELAWIKDDLQLTPEQYARIKAIHQQSGPHLLNLATRVAHLREEFAAFEHQRKDTGEIDFLEFARYIDERRRIDRECLTSTRQLVDASSEVLTPGQRSRYLTLLPAAVRPTPTSTQN